MNTVIFNGLEYARDKEQRLKSIVSDLGMTPRLLSVVFNEDESSQVYTKLKMEAAVRVGIEFDRIDVSFKDDYHKIQQIIRQACTRDDVHGVMIQKPAKKTWRDEAKKTKITKFEDWWTMLAAQIDPQKDADCLSPENLKKIYSGDSNFTPATVKAVISTLNEALKKDIDNNIKGKPTIVVGRSDIVGKPLAAILNQKGANVSLLGSKDDLTRHITQADIVISATGVSGLVTGDMVKPGVIAIDIGSPKGDIDFKSVKPKASFITPVPDGVGPITVVSLLENLIQIITQ